jgi:hypothetical protein
MLFAFTLLAAMVAQSSAQTFYWANWNRGNDCLNERRCPDDTLSYTIGNCFASLDDNGVPVFAQMTFVDGWTARVRITFYPIEDSECSLPRNGPNHFVYDLDTCNWSYCTQAGFPCAELVSRSEPTCSPGLSVGWVIFIVVASLGCCFGIWAMNKRSRNAAPRRLAQRSQARSQAAPVQPTYVAVAQQQPAYVQPNQYTQPTYVQGTQPVYQAQQPYQPPAYQQQQYQAYAPVQKPQ